MADGTRHVAFATDHERRTLTPDDRLAVAPLEALGVRVTPAVWNDPSVDWLAFDAVVIRSTWDYYLQVPTFEQWLHRLDEIAAPVLNPVPILRWNMDKRYLRQLAMRGIVIPTTVWAETDEAVDLATLLEAQGWEAAVVKPIVSAGAYGTFRVTRADAATRQAELDALTATRPMMVQRFLPTLAVDGEWSLLFFGGTFSHAVRKRPKAGDFRVQFQHGGEAERADPPGWLVAAAHTVLETTPVKATELLYARVDGVVEAHDGAPRFVLMELEVLEPSLFFTCDPESPRRFAAALRARVDAMQRV